MSNLKWGEKEHSPNNHTKKGSQDEKYIETQLPNTESVDS